jgi:hypothetical protein
MTSYNSLDSIALELEQNPKIRGYPVADIVVNGQKFNGLIYWFHETETLGLWIYGTHIFELQVDNKDRSKFIRAANETVLENKWT